ncbi:hypothetical protein QR680_013683 [Steinernema hermaphroditum]|uniref:ABC transporter domain-containing protein n=1 Tax=Steinernema hermaphroditum TaxID=289476 RepID=A0AA39M2Y5_9BILA|nr:hypothetical protein QR680_013683 [Steinernema hermaphroditum]
MGKRSIQLPLVPHDQVQINIEQCEPFEDHDSLTQSLRKATGLSFRPNHDSEVNRTMSTVTVVPAMTLSWHNVVARPIVKDSANKTFLDKVFSVEEAIDGPHLHREKILDNVFGVAEPGEVLALMGASGAGKTSLLNILTHRNLNTLNVAGAIKINGQIVDRDLMRKVSAYVEQDDMFVATMTVKEHLNFVSVLKMGKTHTPRDQRRRVRMVMDDLELHRCADTIIGSPKGTKGLSGGEKKRLAFASEILTSPPILFCDEPTSGLDAFLAQQVVQVLKKLASKKGMTIVLTIHQPSSQVFQLFDKVCLLSEGRTVFLGTGEQAEEMWSLLGYPLPLNFNPADHFIATLAIMRDREEECRGKAYKMCDHFADSSDGRELYRAAVGPLNSTTSNSSAYSEEDIWRGNEKAKLHAVQKYKSTWSQQVWAITKRSFLTYYREPMLFQVRFYQCVLVAAIFSMLYFQVPIKQETVMNVNGLLFLTVTSMNFMFQFAVVEYFCNELPIFLREHFSGLYRIDSYFVAKNLAELPQYILIPVVFSTIIYWMTGISGSITGYLTYVLVAILSANVGISIGYLMSCIFGTLSVAIMMLPIFVIPLLAFGGFYMKTDSIPSYFQYLRYLSYFNYGFETLAISEWSRVESIPGCTSASAEMTGGRCYKDGRAVLESFNFQEDNFYRNIGIMFFMIFTFRILAYLALFTKTSLKR